MAVSTATRVRIPFDLMTACTVYSYPSHGGIITKNFTDLELELLGLSHKMSDPISFSDQDQEDAFALRMLRLGARWWPSPKFYKCHITYDIYPYGYHFPSDFLVTYTPTDSSVWVLAVGPRTHNHGGRNTIRPGGAKTGSVWNSADLWKGDARFWTSLVQRFMSMLRNVISFRRL